MGNIRLVSENPAPNPSKKAVFASRLFSTLLMWALVTGTFVSGQAWAFTALVSLLGALCFYELLEMAGSRSTRLAKLVTATLGVVTAAGMIWGFIGGGNVAAVGVGGLALVTLANFGIAMRRAPNGEQTLIEIVLPIMAYLLAVLMFFGGVSALMFAAPGSAAVPGAWLVLYCVLATKFSDMGAYLTGVTMGKRKMIPHISPGKTWAGFVGALVFPVATSCALYATLGEKLVAIPSWADAVIIGLLLGLIAVIGDLAASVVKRCLARKDSGRFLPGIGGIFDLIDSICFSAPLLWLYLVLRGTMSG